MNRQDIKNAINKKRNEGYLRFKKQLTALNRGDLATVKKLAKEAAKLLEIKRENTLRLPYVN